MKSSDILIHVWLEWEPILQTLGQTLPELWDLGLGGYVCIGGDGDVVLFPIILLCRTCHTLTCSFLLWLFGGGRLQFVDCLVGVRHARGVMVGIDRTISRRINHGTTTRLSVLSWIRQQMTPAKYRQGLIRDDRLCQNTLTQSPLKSYLFPW